MDHAALTFESDLLALLEHADLLKSGEVAADPYVLPGWPRTPVHRRSYAARKVVIATCVATTAGVAPHALQIAELVFGAPARPTLTGHKVGSPWDTPADASVGSQTVTSLQAGVVSGSGDG